MDVRLCAPFYDLPSHLVVLPLREWWKDYLQRRQRAFNEKPRAIASFSWWQDPLKMDVTRSTSPPSIRVQNFNGKQRSMSKSSLMPLARTREPMLIPNARGPPPPPPLPPPTDLNTLAAVDDPGWAFANLSGGAMFGNSRASLSSDSGVPRGWNIKTEEDDSGRPPDVMRRNSSAATVKSSLGLNTTHAFSMHHEGYHGLTGSNPPSYQSVFTFFSHSFIAGVKSPA